VQSCQPTEAQPPGAYRLTSQPLLSSSERTPSMHGGGGAGGDRGGRGASGGCGGGGANWLPPPHEQHMVVGRRAEAIVAHRYVVHRLTGEASKKLQFAAGKGAQFPVALTTK
jgi:hypothetical protein